ncbi:MAG: glycosyltransferase [Chitinophagaceae bacterium]|nr:glycosyltransferase [Chitinophagaceae bacterium]
MDKHLHIVCMDVPFPADYGGVVDPFHKMRCLHEAGVKIHLHCFEYGRGEQAELNAWCEEVKYYSRREGHKGFSHKLPYIVCSRSNGELLENLLQDDHPILLEGVHCSYLLNDERFSGRQVILRLHNVEYQYYRQLYYCERSLLKKMYYLHESNLLRQYEKKIADKAMILAMVEKDREEYRQEFGAENIHTLPVFLPFEEVLSKEGTGCFCLYHGNLSVAENEQAVAWLLKQVFHCVDLPLIVTGKNPSARLSRMVEQHPHACLIPNPSDQEIQDLIAKAQINILPSFNCTGIKMKLLNALFNGRHCVVNRDAVKGTGLEAACHIADNTEELIDIISQLYTKAFTAEEIGSRRALLSGQYNNEKNTRRLIQWIWQQQPVVSPSI